MFSQSTVGPIEKAATEKKASLAEQNKQVSRSSFLSKQLLNSDLMNKSIMGR